MSEAQLMGQAPRTLAARFFLSMLVNSGTAWAGLGVFAGFLVRKSVIAALVSPAALLLALASHYAVGRLLGIMHSTIWQENVQWFVAAVILGVPLGIVGAAASRPSWLGLIAAMVVPLGAIAEPFYLGHFWGLSHPHSHWPTGIANVGTGTVLALAGTVGVAVICRRWWRVRSGGNANSAGWG